jgi:hypothetical protein
MTYRATIPAVRENDGRRFDEVDANVTPQPGDIACLQGWNPFLLP